MCSNKSDKAECRLSGGEEEQSSGQNKGGSSFFCKEPARLQAVSEVDSIQCRGYASRRTAELKARRAMSPVATVDRAATTLSLRGACILKLSEKYGDMWFDSVGVCACEPVCDKDLGQSRFHALVSLSSPATTLLAEHCERSIYLWTSVPFSTLCAPRKALSLKGIGGNSRLLVGVEVQPHDTIGTYGWDD